jgi:hypothetical protein
MNALFHPRRKHIRLSLEGGWEDARLRA